MKGAIIALSLFFALVFVIASQPDTTKPHSAATGTTATTIIPPRDPAPIPPDVTLGKMDRSYNVLVGAFTLKNPNDFPIADAEIECPVFAPSGTTLYTYRFKAYELIPAKGTKTIREHNFGFWPQQGKSLSCSAISAKRR